MKVKITPDSRSRAEDQARGPGKRGNGLRWAWLSVATGGALLLLIGLLAPAAMMEGAIMEGEQTTITADPSMDQLISVESVVLEGDRATVKIKNQSPFLVIVHAGGVRVGWMRPQRVGIIRGLTSGYHKFFVHSQYGTVSWGPKEVWVPGSWNLVY